MEDTIVDEDELSSSWGDKDPLIEAADASASAMGTNRRCRLCARIMVTAVATLVAGEANPLQGGEANPLQGGEANPLQGAKPIPFRGAKPIPFRGRSQSPSGGCLSLHEIGGGGRAHHRSKKTK